MSNKIEIMYGLKKDLPVLETGVPGFCTDNGKLYVGNNGNNINVTGEKRAISDSVTSPDSDVSASSKAVKTAYDRAEEAFQYANRGKTKVANSIGSPAKATDTFGGLSDTIDISKHNLVEAINSKLNYANSYVPPDLGNATSADVLSNKTFSSKSGQKIPGAMTNRGAITITPSASNKAIPKGYHNGSGYVLGNPNLKPENIKKNVNIFGIIGALSPDQVHYGKFSVYSWSPGNTKIVDLGFTPRNLFIVSTDNLGSVNGTVDMRSICPDYPTLHLPNAFAINSEKYLLEIVPNGFKISNTTTNGYDSGYSHFQYIATDSDPNKGTKTVVPTTYDQTFNNIIVKGDPNLKPENIVDGVVIFGITGNASFGHEGLYIMGIDGVRDNIYAISIDEKMLKRERLESRQGITDLGGIKQRLFAASYSSTTTANCKGIMYEINKTNLTKIKTVYGNESTMEYTCVGGTADKLLVGMGSGKNIPSIEGTYEFNPNTLTPIKRLSPDRNPIGGTTNKLFTTEDDNSGGAALLKEINVNNFSTINSKSGHYKTESIDGLNNRLFTISYTSDYYSKPMKNEINLSSLAVITSEKTLGRVIGGVKK